MSLSRWTQSIKDSVDRAVRNGWERDKSARALVAEVGAAAQQLINTAVETIARTALWDMATTEMELTWAPEQRWKYLAVLDPSTCNQCSPWADVEGTREELPEVPQHPRCRCVVVPAG